MNQTGQETAHVLRDFMIFQKTHTTNLRDVRSLNMWGFGLSNIDIISKLNNVETISLSLNNIDTLEPFSHCENLQNLYLRQNCITDLREIDYLCSLPRLSSLMLRDNPISSLPNYRSYILKRLPNLKKLDDVEVSLQERDYSVDSNQPIPKSNKRETITRNKSLPSQSYQNKYKTVNNYHYNNYNDVEYSSEDDSYPNNPSVNYNSNAENNDPRRRMNSQNRINNYNSNYMSNTNYKNMNSTSNYNNNYNNNYNKPIKKNDSNMLTAVLSLLPELSDDSLQVVLEAIQKQRNC